MKVNFTVANLQPSETDKLWEEHLKENRRMIEKMMAAWDVEFEKQGTVSEIIFMNRIRYER